MFIENAFPSGFSPTQIGGGLSAQWSLRVFVLLGTETRRQGVSGRVLLPLWEAAGSAG